MNNEELKAKAEEAERYLRDVKKRKKYEAIIDKARRAKFEQSFLGKFAMGSAKGLSSVAKTADKLAEGMREDKRKKRKPPVDRPRIGLEDADFSVMD